jgi:hypothetical protein
MMLTSSKNNNNNRVTYGRHFNTSSHNNNWKCLRCWFIIIIPAIILLLAITYMWIVGLMTYNIIQKEMTVLTHNSNNNVPIIILPPPKQINLNNKSTHDNSTTKNIITNQQQFFNQSQYPLSKLEIHCPKHGFVIRNTYHPWSICQIFHQQNPKQCLAITIRLVDESVLLVNGIINNTKLLDLDETDDSWNNDMEGLSCSYETIHVWAQAGKTGHSIHIREYLLRYVVNATIIRLDFSTCKIKHMIDTLRNLDSILSHMDQIIIYWRSFPSSMYQIRKLITTRRFSTTARVIQTKMNLWYEHLFPCPIHLYYGLATFSETCGVLAWVKQSILDHSIAMKKKKLNSKTSSAIIYLSQPGTHSTYSAWASKLASGSNTISSRGMPFHDLLASLSSLVHFGDVLVRRSDIFIISDQPFSYWQQQQLRDSYGTGEIQFRLLTGTWWSMPSDLDITPDPSYWSQPGYSLGYRCMIQFWAIHVFDFITSQGYRYVTRLDDDSMLYSPMVVDPIARMERTGERYLCRIPWRDSNAGVLFVDYLYKYLLEKNLITPIHSTTVAPITKTAAMAADIKTYYNNVFNQRIDCYNNFFIADAEWFATNATVQEMLRYFQDRIFIARTNDLVIQSVVVNTHVPGGIGYLTDFSYGHITETLAGLFSNPAAAAAAGSITTPPSSNENDDQNSLLRVKKCIEVGGVARGEYHGLQAWQNLVKDLHEQYGCHKLLQPQKELRSGDWWFGIKDDPFDRFKVLGNTSLHNTK